MNPELQWSTREKLAIASYVFHSGDQHWTGNVSRLLRPLGDPNRPADWFSPKHCAQQYTALVEAAESTRRKRPERSDSNDSLLSTLQVPTPSVSELVLKKVTQERIEELKKLIRNEKAKYKQISQTVEQLESGELKDKIDEMYEEMQIQIQQDELTKQTLSSKSESSTTSANTVEKSHQQTVTSNENPKAPIEQSEEKGDVLPVTENKEEKHGESPAPGSRTLEVIKASDENALETNAIPPQQSLTKVEKDGTTSPATSSSRSLPTPTPVVESDSSDEDIAMEDPYDTEKVNRDNAMDISQSSTQDLPLVEETPSTLETSEVDSTVISMQTHDNLEEKTLENKDLNSSEQREKSVEPILESFMNNIDIESAVKSEDAESETMDSEQTSTNVDLGNLNELEPVAELETKETTTQLSSEESLSQDNNTSQDTATIETPDVSVIEGVVPVLQKTVDDERTEKTVDDERTEKTVDDERTEEESIECGSTVSSTPAYVESFPNSPALSTTSDADPETTAQHRAWKKSITILWKQVASHRYASIFLQPVTNEIAPNYSSIVLRPMDLSTLKRNVENGVVRTTSEFQRDLMLMFQNALMYNNCEHDVYKMTQDMQKDVMDQVEQFLTTQMIMETTKQQIGSKGLRRSTLRKSVVIEKAGKRTTDDMKVLKK